MVYLNFVPLRKDEEKKRVCILRRDSRGKKFYVKKVLTSPRPSTFNLMPSIFHSELLF